MTPEDDLKVGQWIAIVTEIVADTSEGPEWSPFGWGHSPRRESNVDGRPLRILAISLPFIAVTDGMNRFPIDVRESKVTKLSSSYVKAMARQQLPRHQQGRSICETLSANRFVISEPPERISEEKPERACPLCGDRLIERHREKVWFLACRLCGFEGGPPASKG